MESLSIVLLEGWLLRRPALVNGHSAVLAGQARRSGGAAVYTDYLGFESGVEALLGAPELAERLGANGREYSLDQLQLVRSARPVPRSGGGGGQPGEQAAGSSSMMSPSADGSRRPRSRSAARR